ncbi:fatty acid desaturase-domain-containing protein [Gigaspora rosea]|uniref:Fatty acid desaturase-domain-containing protein n=1 Tax=Gigaspora rosea TaxID=44941 RepID=A0A397UVV3_9GLOM|nr:fatty acid desaturase-domain-containing protein [Gigaspora rosea]
MPSTNHDFNIAYDYRHPFYIGSWRRNIAYIDEDFVNDNLDEPHMKRRFTILSQYPKIKDLYGYDILTVYIAIVGVIIQVTAAYIFGRWLVNSDLTMLVVSFILGGTMTQIYSIIIHETAHSLVAKSDFQNRIIGLISNIPLPIPIAMSFRRHHLEHHAFQGVEKLDPDLPSELEKNFGSSTVFKLLWLLFHPIIYPIRNVSMFRNLQLWEYINLIFTLSTNIVLYNYCGYRGLLYLFMSLWFGYSVHPVAARYIQEHYTFDDGQETYSYYGSLNTIFMNIGYHTEHHDFTNIPWTKLPEIRKIAPEYYENLAYHTSWFMVQWNFITQRQFGLQNRVKRSFNAHKRGRKMVKVLKKTLLAS